MYAIAPKREFKHYGPSASESDDNREREYSVKDGHRMEITGLIMGEQRAFFKGPMVLEDRTEGCDRYVPKKLLFDEKVK